MPACVYACGCARACLLLQAPEVLADKGYAGQPADVWSMGVVLYVLMAGYLPFDEPHMSALFRKIQVSMAHDGASLPLPLPLPSHMPTKHVRARVRGCCPGSGPFLPCLEALSPQTRPPLALALSAAYLPHLHSTNLRRRSLSPPAVPLRPHSPPECGL
jgi:serine/threonine protein kinase